MLEKFIMLMIAGPKRDEKGATATEYGLLVGLIALIIVVGVGLFGNALNGFFDGLSDTVGSW
jgi:pilus assembly protein Flp/PilA